MSRKCSLIAGKRRLKGNKIAIERSRVTKRTKKFFEINLQPQRFKIEHINMTLKIQNRTLRTIEKYGGIEKFLLKVKKGHLTELGKSLRKKLQKKTELETPKDSVA